MTNPLQKTEQELAKREAIKHSVERKGMSFEQVDKEFFEVTGEHLAKTPVDICLDRFISCDSRIETIKNQIRKLAPTNLPVLIVGESGTGKELLARALHGARNPNKFIDVNCAGIPDTLLESEFFGAVKGAYTGCDISRQGYLQEATGGTLFLDEIGDMPLLLQAKLLRVIQQNEARPLGSNLTYKVNCRFIAATNRSVEELKNNKALFRQDLFYRLAGHILIVPALRDRLHDIKPIVEGLDYTWRTEYEQWNETAMFPGNVRELINILESDRIINS
jgi:transcriptional regulator with PAS, ATPase and Fis domain